MATLARYSWQQLSNWQSYRSAMSALVDRSPRSIRDRLNLRGKDFAAVRYVVLQVQVAGKHHSETVPMIDDCQLSSPVELPGPAVDAEATTGLFIS